MSNSPSKTNINPIFYRADLASILNCTTLTISNREKKGVYPEPARSPSNYRIYTIEDIFRLQLITYKKIFISPIISHLWDSGYKDAKLIESYVNSALESFRSSLNLTESQVSSS